MYYNCNGNNVLLKPHTTTDTFGFNEMGGVEQLIYHPFRFQSYLTKMDGGDWCACPVCKKGKEPETVGMETVLSGLEILQSLLNLAKKIDRFDTKEAYTQMIVKWCVENMHPYSIEFIYSELTEKHFDIEGIDAEFVESDGVFKFEDFMTDLGKIYNAAKLYFTLENMCLTDDVYDDGYEELRNKLIECIPNFNTRLKVNTQTGKLLFSVDVYSVFDIAWYTFAKMLSVDSSLEYKRKKTERTEGIMICCKCCGDFLFRRSARQEYCDKEECQKARKAQNQKDFRRRKSIEKEQVNKSVMQ